MKQLLVIIIFTVFVSGCAKLKHLDQLLTLQDYGREKDAQEEYIQQRDQQFSQLVDALKTGKIKTYSNRLEIERDFGQPIFKKILVGQEVWMYRQQTKYADSEKIYLYFNLQGKLIESKRIEAVRQKEQQAG